MIRIISGKFKGKKLIAPKIGTRPMTDRARSALFSMLYGKIDNGEVLDLFAGSGSLGIESLSRGAKHAVFVDIAKEAEDCIYKNIKECQIEKGIVEIYRTDAMKYVIKLVHKVYEYSEKKISIDEVRKFDIIFITPPYKDLSTEIIRLAGKILKDDGVLITDAPQNTHLPDEVGELKLFEKRNYGRLDLYFFIKKK